MEENNEEKFKVDTENLKNETMETAKKVKESMKGANIKEETEKYTTMLKEETEKNKSLKKEKDNLETDETYERIARENLGMLKANELQFVDASAEAN